MKRETRVAIIRKCSGYVLAYVFRGCSRLEKLVVSENSTDIVERLNEEGVLGEISVIMVPSDLEVKVPENARGKRISVLKGFYPPQCTKYSIYFENFINSVCESLKNLLKTTLPI